MATARSFITETFTGAASIGQNVLEVRGDSAFKLKYLAIQITGNFSGTIRLETSMPNANTWALVQNGTFTLAGTDGISTIAQVAADEDVRLNCTALAAGTANCVVRVMN